MTDTPPSSDASQPRGPVDGAYLAHDDLLAIALSSQDRTPVEFQDIPLPTPLPTPTPQRPDRSRRFGLKCNFFVTSAVFCLFFVIGPFLYYMKVTGLTFP
mmetsp:Transcript_34706/g.80253  ORF Transcript_34706/g.80253 Transcript_34706/m.80253 type:complete len:100 (-) Transcript_34706:165-464(-)